MTDQSPLDLGDLLSKLEPLIQSGRLDNLVDALSLVSDTVDLLDPAMVEKLALLFEQITAATWSLGNAVRMASAQTAAQTESPSLRQLLSLLRQEDTRRGCAVALRTLNVIGRQL
ncbi:hypothetical protein TU86_02615 [Pseudomonas weihenstephanensis]|uniref:DUF1641 domain-containing protein n=1 Tax=Pseudomonas weihenstephanensis TaxID=1608994 RepID=A0A0J6IUY1_9PSED|nr:hypothetical protein TU86_02615 [Pseudomonas weihenstephanensis]